MYLVIIRYNNLIDCVLITKYKNIYRKINHFDHYMSRHEITHSKELINDI